MKLTCLVVVLFLLSCDFVNSQTLLVPGGTSGIGDNSTNSYVGIGTTSAPTAKLEVASSTSYSAKFSNLSLGTYLQLGATSYFGLFNTNTHAFLFYKPVVSSNGIFGSYANQDLFFNTGVTTTTTGTTRMTIDNTYGWVGIGTSSPAAMLDILDANTGDYGYSFVVRPNRDLNKAVSVYRNDLSQEVFTVWGNGVVNTKKIYAESFQVRPDAMGISWFDYVFDDDYSMMSLYELENYINKEKHLPDVPSATDVQANGFSLEEMDGILLKKVEELTLYTIQQQKEIDALKAIISEQNKNIQVLMNELDSL